jgi:hypothetical protein
VGVLAPRDNGGPRSTWNHHRSSAAQESRAKGSLPATWAEAMPRFLVLTRNFVWLIWFFGILVIRVTMNGNQNYIIFIYLNDN